jgi:hypothetical protein
MSHRILFNGFISRNKFTRGGIKSPLITLTPAKKIGNSLYFSVNQSFNKDKPCPDILWSIDTDKKKIELTVEHKDFINTRRHIPHDFLVTSLSNRDPTIHDILEHEYGLEEVNIETHDFDSSIISGKFFKGFAYTKE